MYNKGLDWAAAPLPHPADRPDLANPTIVESNVLCLPRGSKHPKEAFEFIAFVQSQKGMELLCMGQKKLSPLRKVSKEFLANHPNPRIKLFMDLAYGKNVFGAPKLGIWTEYSNEINAAFDTIMLMQKTPQQAMDDLAARMQPKLDDYTKRLRMRGEIP
jgi:ABC-type glycerol-3-phosphate transport system substrate-binding protein